MEDLRENLEIESGFLKGTVFHLDFTEGGRLHFESKYVINEQTGTSGKD